MLNSHCKNNDNNNNKEIKIKNLKKCGQLVANPNCSRRFMNLTSAVLSNRLRRSMQIFAISNKSAVSVNSGAFLHCCSVLICRGEYAHQGLKFLVK